MSDDAFYDWVENKCFLFTAYDKNEYTSWQILSFVRLFLGNENIHSMWNDGRISTNVKNLLYAINEDNPLWVKGLRNRFISFGLFRNFTEYDIDDLLMLKQLPPISEPESAFDVALLEVIQLGHYLYPYEFELLRGALEKINHILGGPATYASSARGSATIVRRSFYAGRMVCYQNRLPAAEEFYNDYKESKLREDEKLFDERAAGGFSLADFARDVLERLLVLNESGGVLTNEDIRDLQEFLLILEIMDPEKGLPEYI